MILIRTHHLAVGLLILAACGSDNAPDSPPGWLGGDGGPMDRIVPEAGMGPDDPRTDGGIIRDASSDLPPGAMVNVSFEAVLKDAIVKTTEAFKPTIAVDVTAALVADLPRVAKVSVQVFTAPAARNAVPVATVMLEQIGAPVLGPVDMPSARYKFGNVLVSLADFKTGAIELRAVAVTDKDAEAKASVTVRVDAGPTIKFIKPAEGQPFKSSASIEVEITDATYGPPSDITFKLGSAPIPFEKTADSLFVATIDFPSFTPPLTGEQLLTVSARNSNGSQTFAERKFVADNIGPTFEASMPAPGQMIGGVVEISVVVKDPAKVEESSVLAVIGNGADAQFELRLDPPPAGSTEARYSKRFDAKLLPATAIFPTVSFRASDKLGNQSSTGYLVSLDTQPPLLDLDPPDDFRFDVKTGTAFLCTPPFDPVGPDAVDDGQIVNQAFDVRVRAEDQGNAVAGGDLDFTPIAGVKKVDLVVLDDTARALVVDTNGDGDCDAINPTLVPTTQPMNSNDILLLALDPIAPGGTPDKQPSSAGLAKCQPHTAPIAPPDPICNGDTLTSNPMKGGEYMSVFIHHAFDKLPAIWAPGPVRSGLECAGRQLEAVGSNIKDGWACLAAVAEDRLGQKQVSRPIRICIDHDGKGNECPAHRKVNNAQFVDTAVVSIETVLPHELATGDEVFLQGVICGVRGNGKHKATVTSTTGFTVPRSGGTQCSPEFDKSFVVAFKHMPDCSGVQTAKEPMPAVDEAATCAPWRKFERDEVRAHK